MKTTTTTVAVLFFLFMLTSFSEAVTDFSKINSTTVFANCNPPPRCASKTTPLFIQGFVPADNDVYSSETIIPAAYLAIDDINGNCSILPGYYLQLEFVNTMCDPSEATWQLINSIVLQDAEPRIMFLGGGCSLATEPLAALAGRFYQIPILSYGASSPSLSEREMFPTFFRTIPSETQSNSARFAIMRNNSWEKVATLHETQTIFSQTVDDFHNTYDETYGKNQNPNNSTEEETEEDENLILRSFTDDPDIPLRQIKGKDIRIIMGFFYEDKARITVCTAIEHNLTGPNHVWIFPAWYASDWYNTTKYPDKDVNCTVDQMLEAVRFAFFLDSYNFGENKTVPTDTASETAEKFEDDFNCYLAEFQNHFAFQQLIDSDSNDSHAYRTFTYDAIWTMAFALDGAEKELLNMNTNLTEFKYFNESTVADVVKKHINMTNFSGVSGKVTFDKLTGSRKGLNGIYQFREDNNGELKLELIAIHDPTADDMPDPNNQCIFLQCIHDPQWKGGMVPPDRQIPQNKYLNEGLVIACDLFIAIAIVIAVGLLIFNLATLWKPLIRDSAPHINTVIIIGCMVMLVTCILLGIDSSNPDTDEYVTNNQNDESINEDDYERVLDNRNLRYSIVCTLRLWFLTLGFTLSFGALFAKTWQVYHIYTNPKLKKEPFKMWNFLIIMTFFLVVDLTYLSFWTGVFPFRREMEMRDSGDKVLVYERCNCNNFGYLIGALYVYKGLFVVFGLFLAYESRNVKYIYINDSRFVSITMYIVVILVGIGAPLSLVLAVHLFHDTAYALAVLMIIAACLSCLLILYIPKFVYMAKGKETMVRENSREEITVSDGLQLGRTTVDQGDVREAEDEVSTLKTRVAEREIELRKLKDGNRNGSDGDSGVLVTGDENDTFSSVSTTNGDHQRTTNTSPIPDTKEDLGVK